jgi:hypothetical protein
MKCDCAGPLRFLRDARENGLQREIEVRSGKGRQWLKARLLGAIRNRIANFGRRLCEDGMLNLSLQSLISMPIRRRRRKYVGR